MGTRQAVALWLQGAAFFSATLLFPTVRSNLGLDEQVQYSEEIIVMKRHVRHERLTEIKRSKAGWREIGIEICIYSRTQRTEGPRVWKALDEGMWHVRCPGCLVLNSIMEHMEWYVMVYYCGMVWI